MSEKTPFEKWKEENDSNLQEIKKEAAIKLEASKVKPWDILNPKEPKALDILADQRYNICLSCPELIKFSKQCKKCGCFMAVKTKLENAACPIGKW
jgi:hypothetical protein